MYLPVGPEHESLRRNPWITLGLIAAVSLVYLYHMFYPTDIVPALRAMRFAAARPYLNIQPEIAKLIRDNPDFIKVSPRPSPDNPAELVLEQKELNDLTELGLKKLYWFPARIWGLETTNPWPHKMITHVFYHERIWQAALAALVLYLSAPFVEDRWGRVFFPVFLAMSAVVTSIAVILMSGGSWFLLYGMGGVAAAVMGAYAVTFYNQKIMASSLMSTWSDGWRLSPLAIIPVIFVLELAYAFVLRDKFPDLMVLSASHFTGFLFGAIVALALKVSRLENKLYQTEYDKLPEHIKILDEADHHLKYRETEKAFETLQKGWRKYPNDPEITERYWNQAFRLRREHEARDAGVALATNYLEKNDYHHAYFVWREISQALPGLHLGLKTVTSLIDGLATSGEKREASDLLEHSMNHLPPDVERDILFPFVEIANFTDPVLCLSLLDKVQDQFSGDDRAWLDEVRQDCTVRQPKQVDGAEEEGIPISEQPINPDMMTSEDDPFAPSFIKKLQIHHGAPLALTDKGLAYQLENGKKLLMPYDRIKAIGAGVIREIGGAPYLLLDLFADDPMHELEKHRCLRLNSRKFDPRHLIKDEDNPMAALKKLVVRLLDETEATAMPDYEALAGDRFPTYPGLYDFETSVYGVSEA